MSDETLESIRNSRGILALANDRPNIIEFLLRYDKEPPKMIKFLGKSVSIRALRVENSKRKLVYTYRKRGVDVIKDRLQMLHQVETDEFDKQTGYNDGVQLHLTNPQSSSLMIISRWSDNPSDSEIEDA